MLVVAAAGKGVACVQRLDPQGALAAPRRPLPCSTKALSRRSRTGAARLAAAAASFGSAAEAAPYLATGVDWAVEVTRHTLTMPQVSGGVDQSGVRMPPFLVVLPAQRAADARARRARPSDPLSCFLLSSPCCRCSSTWSCCNAWRQPPLVQPRSLAAAAQPSRQPPPPTASAGCSTAPRQPQPSVMACCL